MLSNFSGVSSWFDEFKIFIDEKHEMRDWRESLRTGMTPQVFFANLLSILWNINYWVKFWSHWTPMGYLGTRSWMVFFQNSMGLVL